MPLQLREYQKNDFIALKNIIRKTWRYDEFSSLKNRVQAGRRIFEQLSDQLHILPGGRAERQTRGHYSGKGYRASHVSASEQIPAASGRSVALSHQRGPVRIQNF